MDSYCEKYWLKGMCVPFLEGNCTVGTSSQEEVPTFRDKITWIVDYGIVYVVYFSHTNNDNIAN
jgi:hypothetical protein